VKQGGHGQKAGEPRQVSDERLRLDFLLQVELGVGGESLAAVGRRPDDGKGAVPQRLVEVEVTTQFLRQKGVEVAAYGTPGQQIGPRGLELAGARSTEDEAKPPILDVAMDLVSISPSFSRAK